MSVEVVTVEDLENFRLRLLKDIENLLGTKRQKKWLKTADVMEMFGMS